MLRIRTEESVKGPSWPPPDVTGNVRSLQTAARLTGPPSYWLTDAVAGLSYLPLRISCCLMFFMKWIFLKLFGRGEPERVRHLKGGTKAAAVSVGSSGSQEVGRAAPTAALDSVLPAEGSVLLDVLQRFE